MTADDVEALRSSAVIDRRYSADARYACDFKCKVVIRLKTKASAALGKPLPCCLKTKLAATNFQLPPRNQGWRASRSAEEPDRRSFIKS